MIVKKVEEWMTKFNRPFNTDSSKKLQAAFEMFKEEYEELCEAIARNDEIEIMDGIADLLWTVIQYSFTKGYNPTDLIDAVYESNMSKLITDKEQGELEVSKYNLNNPEVEQVFLEYDNDKGYGYLKRIRDGKIRKTSTFKEPKFITP